MERERTVVDYRKTVEEIYIGLSRASISKREIMDELSRAVESITKNSEFRPFLARLLHVLDIDFNTVYQILLPRNEEISPSPKQSQWISESSCWQVGREIFYWEAEQSVVQLWALRRMIPGMQIQGGPDDCLSPGFYQHDQLYPDLGLVFDEQRPPMPDLNERTPLLATTAARMVFDAFDSSSVYPNSTAPPPLYSPEHVGRHRPAVPNHETCRAGYRANSGATPAAARTSPYCR
ncbi:hypothetical protein MAJ_07697, partial [Metarhizium majus ARSEF 297]